MRKRIALFIVSVLLVFLTINFFGIGEVTSIIEHSNVMLITLAIGCQLMIFLLYSLRFKVMTSKYKKISFKDALYISTIGNFVSSLTPIAKVGGQPLMIYMTQGKIGSEKSSAVVFMDTIIDILASVIVAGLVLIVFFNVIPGPILLPLILFVVIAFAIIFGFMKLFLSKSLLARLFNWLLKKVRRYKKIHNMFHVQTFEKSFRVVLEDKKLMSAGMVISFVIKIFEVTRIWIVFSAIGVVLTANVLWIIWAFMLMILLIPWLPGHLGLYEFGVSSGFIMLGVASQKAAGGVLLDRFVSFWFVAVFAISIIWLSRQRIEDMFSMAEKKS